MKEIEGICPAMITPFDSEDKLDLEVFKKHATMVIENGVHGLCVGGSTGEFEAMSFEEAVSLCKAGVEVAEKYNRYVIAGMGGRSTKEACSYAKAYEEAGADVLLVLPPYYYGFSNEEIIQYYCDIANSTKLPLMIYNNPGKTNVKITPEMVAKMAEKCDNIKYEKDSSADIRNISAVIKATNGKVNVFCGWESINLQALLMGAKGLFSGGGGNSIPNELVKLYDYVMNKDYDNAHKQWDKISPYQILMEDHGRLSAWAKAAVKLVHYDVGQARKPYAPVTEKEIGRIRTCLEEINIL